MSTKNPYKNHCFTDSCCFIVYKPTTQTNNPNQQHKPKLIWTPRLTPALRRRPLEIPPPESTAWSHPRSRKNPSWRRFRLGYLGVSKNRGTLKSSIFNRVFHYFHHPFWGIPIFGNIHLACTHFIICCDHISPHPVFFWGGSEWPPVDDAKTWYKTNKQTEFKKVLFFFLRASINQKPNFDFLTNGSFWDLHGCLYNNHKDIFHENTTTNG